MVLAVAVAIPGKADALVFPANLINMRSFHAGWYLIYTKPRHEKKVYSSLTEMSIKAYLPLTKKLRNWHDRKKYIDEPLFPSYVFVYLDDMQSYYAGMDSGGALYYVKMGNEIARVNEAVVNNIRLIASQDKEFEVSACRFAPGQQLFINKGVLTGLSCEVIKIDNKQKLLVRVELLRRNLVLSMPLENFTSLF
jgi:transcriptional antiterminator RfaH